MSAQVQQKKGKTGKRGRNKGATRTGPNQRNSTRSNNNNNSNHSSIPPGSVTTRNSLSKSNEIQDNRAREKASTLFDGTGRLYECMSIAELTIRLRNLADHSLQTHEGDVQQREQLLHEIKDAQKRLNDLLKELKDEMLSGIRDKAKNTGKNAEQLIQLQKENEDLASRLRGAEQEVADAEQKLKDLQAGIKQQVDAVEAQRNKDIEREQKNAKNYKREAAALKKQLEAARGELADHNNRIGELRDQLKENENAQQGLRDEIDSLKEQLNAKDLQGQAVKTPDKRLQARVNELEEQAKNLREELGRVTNEAHTKESTISDLVEQNKTLENDMSAALKRQFDDLFDKINALENNKRDTEGLKKYYKEHLDRMHKLWEEASDEIKGVFEQNYKDLKEKLESAYDQARDRCNQLSEDNKRLNERVTALNDEKQAALNQLAKMDGDAAQQAAKIEKLNGDNTTLSNQLVDMQVKLSQYRIIWNHYMTLEGKLKNEIGHLDKSVADFEEQMRVEPPMPKRRQQRIGVIREYNSGRLPLELSEVPTPELLYFHHHFSARRQSQTSRRRSSRRNGSISDNNNNNNNNNNNEDEKELATDDIDNSRFLLVNYARNTHFTLVGEWYLVNDRNDRIPLPVDLQLAPGGSIGICMGDEKLHPGDILLKECRTRNNLPFITFSKHTDRLYLEDTVGERMELFSPSLPTTDEVNDANNYIELDNDDDGGYIEDAQRVRNYLGVGELKRLSDKPYFTLVNLSEKPVVLRGFKLRREKGSFQMRFPEIEIRPDRPLKFLFATRAEDEDDVLINPTDFGSIDKADNLILEDRTGGRYTVLPHIPSPQRPNYTTQTDQCFVM